MEYKKYTVDELALIFKTDFTKFLNLSAYHKENNPEYFNSVIVPYYLMQKRLGNLPDANSSSNHNKNTDNKTETPLGKTEQYVKSVQNPTQLSTPSKPDDDKSNRAKTVFKLLSVVLLLIIIITLSIYFTNYIILQVPADNIIKNDSAFKSLQINVQYKNYIDFSNIVINIESDNTDLSNFKSYLFINAFHKEINFDKYKSVRIIVNNVLSNICLLYTSPSPRD